MHDLRKKVLLESGKTQSRKARTKPESLASSPNHSPRASPPSSRVNSRVVSRTVSRAGSRYGTDDECDSDSDADGAMTMSSNSLSEDGADEDGAMGWMELLQKRIADLGDRKHSSVQGREAALKTYVHQLRHHFAQAQVDNSLDGVMSTLLRSIRSGASELERILAMAALSLTLVTCPCGEYYNDIYTTLQGAAQGAEDEDIKAGALKALVIAAVSAKVSDDAASEVLQLLLDIVESDGACVEADDSAAVVCAALQAWGFLASYVSDLSEQADQAVEVFIDQLDSTDEDVQTMAGTDLALLFEASRSFREDDEEDNDDIGHQDRFGIQHHQHKAVARMLEIIGESSKSVSKKQKRDQRSHFNSIITSLERGKGPGYSTARRDDFGNLSELDAKLAGIPDETYEMGYREKVRVHSTVLIIDSWCLKIKVEMLRDLLGGGLGIHYRENPLVNELMSNGKTRHVSSPAKAKKSAADEDKRRPRKQRHGF